MPFSCPATESNPFQMMIMIRSTLPFFFIYSQHRRRRRLGGARYNAVGLVVILPWRNKSYLVNNHQERKKKGSSFVNKNLYVLHSDDDPHRYLCDAVALNPFRASGPKQNTIHIPLLFSHFFNVCSGGGRGEEE